MSFKELFADERSEQIQNLEIMYLNIESQTVYKDLLKEYTEGDELCCLDDGRKGQFSA